MKKRVLLVIIILLAEVVLINKQVFSQGKFEISAGIGWPDAINLKIKYGNVFQIGLSQGMPFTRPIRQGLPFHNSSYYWGSTSVLFYYHFGAQSKYINQPVWYLSGGLDWIYTSNAASSTWLPLVRFGRTINFSNRLGLCLDGGLVFLSKSGDEFFQSPVLPSGSLGLFFRF
jgi:hypothetical protein